MDFRSFLAEEASEKLASGAETTAGAKALVQFSNVTARLNRLRKKSKLEPSWGIGMHRLNC
jgi:hypothetical protein